MQLEKNMKDKIITGAMCAIGGGILTLIIGFNWGGWVRGSTSLSMGEKMARDAVVERLAPICVYQFNNDPLREENVVTLNEKNSWERGKYIETQGWATMPSEEEPDRSVASKCSQLITENS